VLPLLRDDEPLDRRDVALAARPDEPELREEPVRLDELELRDEPLRLDELRPAVDLALLVPDEELREAVFLLPPLELRAFDPLERLDPLAVRARDFDPLVPRERVLEPPRELDARRVDRPCDCVPSLCPCSCSSPSSSLVRSFFATPAAAVVARPAATPAATFFVTDIPSFCISSSAATFTSLD